MTPPVPTLPPADQIGIISVSSNADDIALAGIMFAISAWIAIAILVWLAMRVAKVKRDRQLKECEEETERLKRQLEIALSEMNNG